MPELQYGYVEDERLQLVPEEQFSVPLMPFRRGSGNMLEESVSELKINTVLSLYKLAYFWQFESVIISTIRKV